MQKKIQINEVLTILELPMNSWTLNNLQISIEEAKILLKEFKVLVKKQHRILIKKYHPDIPANGQIEENKMKQINAVMDVIKQLKILQQPPRPQKVTVRFYRTTGFGGTSSATSSNFYSF